MPHEQAPNRYVTPRLAFQFHYFALRKMHFLLRARAVAVFPGGFGTLDEMMELLTLIQTGKMRPIPVLLFGGDFWGKVINSRKWSPKAWSAGRSGAVHPGGNGRAGLGRDRTVLRDRREIAFVPPLPLAGGVGGGAFREGWNKQEVPTPSPSRKREGSSG